MTLFAEGGEGVRRYQEVVWKIRQKIQAGALKSGERLPSVREMSHQMGFSVVTVHHAYALLESEGAIRAVARSGYYVSDSPHALASFPEPEDGLVEVESGSAPIGGLASKILSKWRADRLDGFGSSLMSGDLFPHNDMTRHLLRVLRRERHTTPGADRPEGYKVLRELVARRQAQHGSIVRAADVVITPDAMTNLHLCLDSVAKPGDTVLVESPSFFPFFAALQRRQIKAIEIYSHPKHGIDADQFGHLLKHNEISACLLMPVHHYPTGVTSTGDTMRRIVELATRRKVPIIESGAFGELSFRGERTSTLKDYDTDDYVLHIGNFADTLGPRYGLGWIINRRFQGAITNLMSASMMRTDGALQRAVAEFMLKQSYDRHLRRLRETLTTRVRRGLALINQTFPRECAISSPTGGFMCWLRIAPQLDALEASRRALEFGIDLAPGPMFSVTHSFRNFVGLNLSHPWTSGGEQKLFAIAQLLRETD